MKSYQLCGTEIRSLTEQLSVGVTRMVKAVKCENVEDAQFSRWRVEWRVEWQVPRWSFVPPGCTAVLLHYCTTVLLYYCTTVLLYYCTTVLL